MRSLFLLTAGALFLTGCLGLPPDSAAPTSWPHTPGDAKSARVLAIPQEEHGYGNFQSQVLDTREQFDAFKGTVEGQTDWHNRAKFLQVLDEAHIDFARESLVLIRQADGSASMSVSLATPRAWGDTLTCTVRAGSGNGNRDMTYRCFAVVVDRRRISRVEVQVKEGLIGKPQETLTIGKQ
jgi:hypothetical protein